MKFKVGDRVKKIGEQYVTYNGETGVIEKYDGSRVPYLVRFNDGSSLWLREEQIEDATIKKSDLKDGDIVTLRNGDRLVLFEEGFTDVSEDSDNMLIDLNDLDDNLNYNRYGNKNEDYDVIKVEHPVKYETVFERKEEEVKELTVDEISEKLGYKVKVVGVDK